MLRLHEPQKPCQKACQPEQNILQVCSILTNDVLAHKCHKTLHVLVLCHQVTGSSKTQQFWAELAILAA